MEITEVRILIIQDDSGKISVDMDVPESAKAAVVAYQLEFLSKDILTQIRDKIVESGIDLYQVKQFLKTLTMSDLSTK